jgi:hypothetical protein
MDYETAWKELSEWVEKSAFKLAEMGQNNFNETESNRLYSRAGEFVGFIAKMKQLEKAFKED